MDFKIIIARVQKYQNARIFCVDIWEILHPRVPDKAFQKSPNWAYHFKRAWFFVFDLQPEEFTVMFHGNDIHPPARITEIIGMQNIGKYHDH